MNRLKTKTNRALYTSLSFSAFISANTPAATLCDKEQTPEFECITENKMSFALCANHDHYKTLKTLQYRAEKESGEKTFIPKELENSSNRFSQNHYKRYKTDYKKISFSDSGIKYEIFKNTRHEDSPLEETGTLTSRNSGALEIKNLCIKIIVDNLGTLLGKLQCDKDDALGCH